MNLNITSNERRDDRPRPSVLVAVSGGVDSACAAFLLAREGYDVSGLFLRLHGLSARSEPDARAVCAKLSVPFYTADYGAAFSETVLSAFERDYLSGKTPNPCVVCNPCVKFRALLEQADMLGCDHIATGHYCSVFERDGRFLLRRSPEKDQSYALYGLSQEQLSRLIMPLGSCGMTKAELRQMAAGLGLSVAEKRDSQELCFVTGSYKDYLRIEDRPGEVVDVSGTVIGRHQGLHRYTVGQRKGLGLAFGKRMFVKEIRVRDNSLVLADDAELFSSALTAHDLNLLAPPDYINGRRLTAKIRYNHAGAPCSAITDGTSLTIYFDEPQRAVTPGQSAVLYDGDVCLGGGVIG